METISIWDAKHPEPVETKQLKLIRVYLGYSRYCLDVAAEYERQSNFYMAEWYRKEALDYSRLAGELENSL